MKPHKTEVKNGITIKYHSDDKSLFAKGKVKTKYQKGSGSGLEKPVHLNVRVISKW